MKSPFTQINTSQLRTERRARALTQLVEKLILAALIAIVLVIANMALTTALTLPDLFAKAAALKGM
jgi:cell division protein FtsL